MRTQVLFLLCMGAMGALEAQQPLSQDDALNQIYNQYDAQQKTAQWICTAEQERRPVHEGWPCEKNDSAVSVSVLLMAEVAEGNTEKVYLAATAKPATTAGHGNYDCHACALAIGMGVFAWQNQRWVLESSNAGVGFYGGWGSPPRIMFVQVGPEKHGLIISSDDVSQGFSSSSKALLMPVDRTVADVWELQDEQDDEEAYALKDKLAPQILYRSSAAFNLFPPDTEKGDAADYYDIEVVSRGAGSKDNVHLEPENWTEIYRFKDGRFRLLSRKNLIEMKRASRKLSK